MLCLDMQECVHARVWACVFVLHFIWKYIRTLTTHRSLHMKFIIFIVGGGCAGGGLIIIIICFISSSSSILMVYRLVGDKIR